jgi:predicted NAD-dependent protein-ADP-ribosyltransferase YbiA (DUF1768 family)
MAKRAGRRIQMRSFFEDEKYDVMLALLRMKFSPGTDLARRLLETGDRELVEGNNWGDRYWGRVSGDGLNRLGEALMQVRGELRG